MGYRFPVTGIQTLLFALLLPFALTGSEKRQGIEHFPVSIARQAQAIPITARLVQSKATPVYVRAYFKHPNETNFRHVDLRGSFDTFSGEIPASEVRPPSIQYFILVLYPDRSIETLPSANPYGRPFEVLVEEDPAAAAALQEKAPEAEDRQPRASEQSSSPPPSGRTPAGQKTKSIGSSEASAYVISPEPGEEVEFDDVLIAAGFDGGEVGIDSASVRIALDGKNLTARASVSEFVVTLSPKRLAPGTHRVIVVARDKKGKALKPLKWTFRVRGVLATENNTQKSYSGRVYSDYRQDKVKGVTRDAFTFGGELRGTAKGFEYNSRVYLTSLESSRLQPINRFSFSARNRYFDIGLGDVYPYYHDLVLWGRRVRGIAASLSFWQLQLQFTTGQTKRTVTPVYDTSVTPATVIAPGDYGQTLTSLRLGLGKPGRSQFGIILLKVNDKTSIDNVTTADAKANSTPQGNLVAGVDFVVSLDNRRFEWRASSAFSLTTDDIARGPDSKAKIDSTFGVSLPFDPASFENWLVLNSTTTPLDPTKLTSLAWQSSLRLNYFRHNIQIVLKKYGSEYISQGFSGLRNNLRGFSITDRINLKNNRLFLNLGFDDYTDNFRKADGNPKIDRRTINAGMSWYPAPHLPTINFTVRNYLRKNDVTASSGTLDLREDNLSRDINMNLQYGFYTGTVQNTAVLTITDSRIFDRITGRSNPDATQDVVTAVKMFNLKSDFAFPLTTTLTFATNTNQSTGGQNQFSFNMLSLRADYQLFRKQLNLYANYRYTSGKGESASSATTEISKVDYVQGMFLFGASLRLQEKHLLLLDVTIYNYTDSGGIFDTSTNTFTSRNPSYNNNSVRLMYEYRL